MTKKTEDEWTGKSFDFTKIEKAHLDNALRESMALLEQIELLKQQAGAIRKNALDMVIENAFGRTGVPEGRKFEPIFNGKKQLVGFTVGAEQAEKPVTKLPFKVDHNDVREAHLEDEKATEPAEAGLAAAK